MPKRFLMVIFCLVWPLMGFAEDPFIEIPSLAKYKKSKKDKIQVVINASGDTEGPKAGVGMTIRCHATASEFKKGKKGKTHWDSTKLNKGKPIDLPIEEGSKGMPGLDVVLKGRRAGADLAIIFPAHMQLWVTTFKTMPKDSVVLVEIKILKVKKSKKKPKAPEFPVFDDKDKRWTTIADTGIRMLKLKAGDGATPKFGQKIQVGWAGWVAPTKHLFDKSDSGAWLPFDKGRSFRGWEEVISRMKIGDEVIVQIPPTYAYGHKGYAPLKIPPDSWLILKIRLDSAR